MKQKPIISVLSFILCLVLLTGTLTACHKVSYPERYRLGFPDYLHPNSIEVLLDIFKERNFDFSKIDYIILPQASEEYELKAIGSEGRFLFYTFVKKKPCETETCTCCVRFVEVGISLHPMQKYEVREHQQNLEKAPYTENEPYDGKEHSREYKSVSVGDRQYLHEKYYIKDKGKILSISHSFEANFEGFLVNIHRRREDGEKDMKDMSEEAVEDILYSIKSFYAMPVTEVKEKGRKALEGTPLYDPVRATITTTTTTTMAIPTYTTESTKKSPSTAESTLNLPTVIVGF